MPPFKYHKVGEARADKVQGRRDAADQRGGHGVREQHHARKLHEGARRGHADPRGQRRCCQVYLFLVLRRVVARVNGHLNTIFRCGREDKGCKHVNPQQHETDGNEQGRYVRVDHGGVKTVGRSVVE